MAASLRNDIVSDHRERMLNLKKYYPFFKLIDVSFSQYKEGKYEMLDMGYIVMGILRFFIEENNFNEKDVTYPEYLAFIDEMFRRDFNLILSPEESRETADYIFDKIKNDGKPFSFTYFDPIDRKKRVSRVRLIESAIREHTVWYAISPEAVAFYLDTKEIRDESRISVQQLLLEKMIKAQNFKGGTEVVERINEEVNRLQLKKKEVLHILSGDVFAGIEAYEEFVSTGMRWFEEEEKLFQKNRELIQAALLKLEETPDSSESYYRTVGDIYALENQLKVAMNRHGELLRACTDLQRLTDDAVHRAKLGRIRRPVDFASLLKDMVKTDRADLLAAVLNPMFRPQIKKTFNPAVIDEALTVRPQKYEEAEKLSEDKTEEIVFADEQEEVRIAGNYRFLMDNLLRCLERCKKITLRQFNAVMCRAYSPDLLKNADYYSFFIHLCQKNRHVIGGGCVDKENYLDEILGGSFCERPKTAFVIEMNSDELLTLTDGCEVLDVTFIRQGGNNGEQES